MSYTPINWQTGDTITAEKLNKMDNGWSVVESSEVLYEGNVTTTLDGGVYSGDIGTTITAPTIKMTFDGSVYNLNQLEDDGDVFYGGFDDYPFVLYSDGYFLTNEAGTFPVKIEVASTVTETSEDFTQAVQSVPMSGTPFMMTVGETTYDEFTAAKAAGRPCFLTYSNMMAFVGYSTPNGVNNDVVIAPTMSGVTFRFNSNGILEAVES